jgi:hypothetical protein
MVCIASREGESQAEAIARYRGANPSGPRLIVALLPGDEAL